MSNRAIAPYMLDQAIAKGTEVARFLRRHSPTPSDFGWPCYPAGCRPRNIGRIDENTHDRWLEAEAASGGDARRREFIVVRIEHHGDERTVLMKRISSLNS